MFHERLTLLCKQHGITVTEVACTHLGVASSAATNWKKGASPRSDIVIRAAEYFRVSTDYLLGLTDSPALPASLGSPDAAISEAMGLLQGASPMARSAALAALQAVVRSIDQPGSSIEPDSSL